MSFIEGVHVLIEGSSACPLLRECMSFIEGVHVLY